MDVLYNDRWAPAPWPNLSVFRVFFPGTLLLKFMYFIRLIMTKENTEEVTRVVVLNWILMIVQLCLHTLLLLKVLSFSLSFSLKGLKVRKKFSRYHLYRKNSGKQNFLWMDQTTAYLYFNLTWWILLSVLYFFPLN